MAYMSEWAGAQPANAVFRRGQLKTPSFGNLFF